uniref:Uncharacterized protein n=1 Tax=Lactuca sativa TaxID=4236 RepID=A0A9R1WR67_LACSA|nr:hypothetical protein LSAT_V11C900501530 [Lactuca sativa]
MDEIREEHLRRNTGSVVGIHFDIVGEKKLFKKFLISCACSRGFVAGYRPYIGLDDFHFKGKFNGVLVTATSIDEIGTPNCLVISSDMQKELEVAIMNGTYIATLRNTFVATYSTPHYELLRTPTEIRDKNKDAIAYLNTNHRKIWSRSKFSITSKCDYITNNISETFNCWIGKFCYKPMIYLLYAIREKIMKQFDKKQNFNLGEYDVTRSFDNQDEVKYKGTR